MQLFSKHQVRKLVVSSMLGALALTGAADVASAEDPGVPAPSLPEIDPTAPPLPGGGG